VTEEEGIDLAEERELKLNTYVQKLIQMPPQVQQYVYIK